MRRSTATVAAEGRVSGTGDTEFAREWTTKRSWDLAATPGWADAWESAEASGITDPGASDVITDAMILSRVQPLLVLFPLPRAACSWWALSPLWPDGVIASACCWPPHCSRCSGGACGSTSTIKHDKDD